MKIGLSSYSLLSAIKSGEMSILDAISWIADNGGEHMEIVPYGYTLVDNPELADAVREKAKEVGIALSNYSMPANFVQDTEQLFEEEVARVKLHVDLVHRLGMNHMRHDVTAFTIPQEKMTIRWFEENLHLMVKGSQLIADYAAQYGITTTIENHGFSVQSSDRVQRVLHAVDRRTLRRHSISATLCAWMRIRSSALRKTCLMHHSSISKISTSVHMISIRVTVIGF